MLRLFAGTYLAIKRGFSTADCAEQEVAENAVSMSSATNGDYSIDPLNVQPQFANDIVKACVILLDYVRDRCGYRVEDVTLIV